MQLRVNLVYYTIPVYPTQLHQEEILLAQGDIHDDKARKRVFKSPLMIRVTRWTSIKWIEEEEKRKIGKSGQHGGLMRAEALRLLPDLVQHRFSKAWQGWGSNQQKNRGARKQ
jgi:hypothetical protein